MDTSCSLNLIHWMSCFDACLLICRCSCGGGGHSVSKVSDAEQDYSLSKAKLHTVEHVYSMDG